MDWDRVLGQLIKIWNTGLGLIFTLSVSFSGECKPDTPSPGLLDLLSEREADADGALGVLCACICIYV